MKHSLMFAMALLLTTGAQPAAAEEYGGITGLIHTPSAEMNPAGMARIGAFFLNREFLPDAMRYTGADGAVTKYHSTDHFLAIAPFDWIELAYTCTLMKGMRNGKARYFMKDRHVSLKLRVIKEGKWMPAIAVGATDPYHFSSSETPDYFRNYYGAATKHFSLRGHELGAHVAYRWYKEQSNKKWQGVTCGLTYRPAFAPNLRGIVEYTGNDINIGADCYLWKLLFVQASLQNGKYFSGGMMLQIQL